MLHLNGQPFLGHTAKSALEIPCFLFKFVQDDISCSMPVKLRKASFFLEWQSRCYCDRLFSFLIKHKHLTYVICFVFFRDLSYNKLSDLPKSNNTMGKLIDM